MLRIRFSRTGKVGQPSYRIVVAQHSAPVKGRFIEMLGHYLPATKAKNTVFDKDRIMHWISKGAIPSDSVAALLKKQGLTNMDKYLEPRNRKRAKKGEQAAIAPATSQVPTSPAPTAQ